MSCRHRTLAAAVFLALAATALPGHAQSQPGARCPADSPLADVTPQYTNNILRCQRRALAPTACPPGFPDYDALNGADRCRAPAIGVPPVAPVCPPNMALQVDGGAGNLDRCRSNNTNYVPPMLGVF